MHFCSKSALQLKMTRSVHMIWCELSWCKAIVAISGYAIHYTSKAKAQVAAMQA